MKSSTAEMSTSTQSSKGTLSVLADLVKARLTGLVLLTTLVGFYLGNEGGENFSLLLATMFGTGLLASGAAALNQYLERNYDGLMPRTQGRPIPAGPIL